MSKLIDKILQEAALNERGKDPLGDMFNSWNRLGRTAAFHHKDFMSSKEGDIVNINGGQYVIMGPLIKGLKSLNVTVPVVTRAAVDTILKGGDARKAIGNLTVKEIEKFEKLGKMKPAQYAQLKAIVSGKRAASDERVASRTSENIDKKQWKDGYWQVQMADGNWAKDGDNVLVKFDNGNFPMQIKAVSGNQEGQVTVIQRGRTKGRAVDVSRILSKVG